MSTAALAAAQGQASIPTQNLSFSFIHILQLVQPVSPTSPYKLPSLGSNGTFILPSRLAKSKAPFPTAPPTNLTKLYELANQARDPDEVRKEKNRRKKERKARAKERREAAIATGDEPPAEDAEEEVDAAEEQAPEPQETAVVAAGGKKDKKNAPRVYGLPLDVGPDLFMQFEARYHQLWHRANLQREEVWRLQGGAADEKDREWGDIILHEARSRRDNKGGFAKSEKDGRWEFHWAV
ncbi:hypothetical protein JCM10207_005679 [Rhodosporidiobolus poonsookiae]